MLLLASALLAYQVAILVLLLYGEHAVRHLPAQLPVRATPWPRVSIVIAARDEEAEIEQALRSVLALDYPEREILVVNDRSTDGTAAILERLQGEHPDLEVVTVTTLPEGWLGKNHALHCGARAARGELLLFTDADVCFVPDTLKRAVATLEADRLDLLTLAPRSWSRSLLVGLLIAFFVRTFMIFMRPWQASNPRSRCHVGIGAFLLVRRQAYEAVGGHARIRLRPDDDLQLARVIKQGGFRHDIRQGKDAISVPWYPSLSAFLVGLEKNAVAGMEYRFVPFFLSLVVLLFLHLAPWGLLVLGDLPTRVLAGAALLVGMASFALYFRLPRLPLVLAIFEPVALLLFVYAFARSGILTWWRGGIAWRGTFYPLEQLRRHRV